MAKPVRRILFFLALVAAAVGTMPAVTLIGALIYTVIYTGPEVIVLGLLMDAYFGWGSGTWYHFTLILAAMVLVVEILRPHLSVYNR